MTPPETTDRTPEDAHRGIFSSLRVQQALCGLLILSVFLFLMHRILSEYDFHEVVREVGNERREDLFWGGIFCALNYFVLTLYDCLAIRYVSKQLRFSRIALTSFVSYTFSNNIGFAVLSGGAVRYRLYTRWGFTPGQIAQVIGFSGVHFWLGLSLLGGVSCFIDPLAFTQPLHLDVSRGPWVASLLLAPSIAYVGLCLSPVQRLTFRNVALRLPSLELMISALTVACVDWLLAACVLYFLIPGHATIEFTHLLAAFFAAQVAGIVSHVPGGLGVFETVMLLSLGPAIPPSTLLGALIVFRAIYYLLPFFGGLAALSLYEIYHRYAPARLLVKKVRPVEGVLAPVIPPVLSIAIFIGGAVLLFSGSTPSISSRLSFLNNFIPLSVLEASHLVNSLVGVGLLVLAWGIQKRLLQAYHLTLLLLVVGALASLLKGLDYEEAAYLFSVLIGFSLSKRYFYRRSSLVTSLGFGSLLGVSGVLICSVWLGFFSYEHVEYRRELWWQFALTNEAPRFLRGTVAAAIVLFALSLQILLRPRPPKFVPPSEEDLRCVQEILKRHHSPLANLAFLKDKSILFSKNRDAFLMYRGSGSSWIALGDPVGPEHCKQELIWHFRDLCDQYDQVCVFYQLSASHIPLYIDVGLKVLKLGEEAVVPLDNFSLSGSRAKSFRQTVKRMERDGYTFSIHPPEAVPALLPQLQQISDDWLRDKNTREKRFSLGSFSPEYLTRFPVALVTRNDEILAFANIWESGERDELSLDLMRHRRDTYTGIMDFLFVNLMVWGKEQGFKRFNLGMAPLSGIMRHRRAPFWNKVSSYLYQHGENFYNFEGLRAYKEKFYPLWQPKYLAFPNNFSLPVAVANIATLISGGVKGIVSK